MYIFAFLPQSNLCASDCVLCAYRDLGLRVLYDRRTYLILFIYILLICYFITYYTLTYIYMYSNLVYKLIFLCAWSSITILTYKDNQYYFFILNQSMTDPLSTEYGIEFGGDVALLFLYDESGGNFQSRVLFFSAEFLRQIVNRVSWRSNSWP